MRDEPSTLCIGPLARRLEKAAERADAQPALAGLVGWRHLRQRAGVHRGRPHLVGGDYLGRDVNLAARGTRARGCRLT